MTVPATMSPDLMVQDIRDHEVRIRHLEQDRATTKKLDELERRVRSLEITAAKAAVIVGAVSFLASAVGSALVALAFRAIGG